MNLIVTIKATLYDNTASDHMGAYSVYLTCSVLMSVDGLAHLVIPHRGLLFQGLTNELFCNVRPPCDQKCYFCMWLQFCF